MISQRSFALAILAALTFSGCGGASSTSVAPPSKQSAAVAVGFSITIPAPNGTSIRTPDYISSGTKSATISASASGQTTQTATVNCTSTCQATLYLQPSISWTFNVSLFSATNGGGSVLSQGSATQTINAGQANSVSLTFNPVVSAVKLAVSGTPLIGAGSATVTITPIDASGATIVGPGNYATSNGTVSPLTLTFANTQSNTLGQFTAPAPFAAPPSGGVISASVTYTGNSVGLQFPIVAVKQNGATVPISGAGAQIAAAPSTPAPGTIPNFTSHTSVSYAPGSNPDAYTYLSNGGSQIADMTTAVQTTVSGAAGNGLTAFDAAGKLWFFDEGFSGTLQFGYATVSGGTITPTFPVTGCGPYASSANALSLSSDGNLWFALGTTTPTVGYINGSNVCSTPVNVGASGDVVAGIVGGPSSATYVLMKAGGLYSITASGSPTLVATLPFHADAIGYSTFDGNLYVQSSVSPFPIYSFSLSTKTATQLCASSPQLFDSHGVLATIHDGTLAYASIGGNVTRIAPGVGCATLSSYLPYGTYFAIAADASGIIGSDGGHVKFVTL